MARFHLRINATTGETTSVPYTAEEEAARDAEEAQAAIDAEARAVKDAERIAAASDFATNAAADDAALDAILALPSNASLAAVTVALKQVATAAKRLRRAYRAGGAV